MRHQQIRTVVTAIALATTVTLSSNAQAQNTSVSQRTAWGQPDIQGIWDFRSITPFERPGLLVPLQEQGQHTRVTVQAPV